MMSVLGCEQIARDFAVKKHGAQMYGKLPYVHHLAEVRTVLARFDLHGDLGVAAWLHDTVEDTSTTLAELTELFGANVSCLVDAVTGLGATRRDRNLRVYDALTRFPEAVPLKLADRIANTAASFTNPKYLQMYRDEYPFFRTRLIPLGAPDAMWDHLDVLNAGDSR